MPQQQSQPQANTGGFPMSPAQKMATEQMANQQRPFGWLMDMIAHITGQGQPQQPAQPNQQTGAKPPKDKQSQDQGAGGPMQGGQGGQIDPSQVPELASIMNPNAATNLGLMPQTQGSFGWLLQMLQQQQMNQQNAQGAGLVQLASTLMGRPQAGLDLTLGSSQTTSEKTAPKAAGKG